MKKKIIIQVHNDWIGSQEVTLDSYLLAKYGDKPIVKKKKKRKVK